MVAAAYLPEGAAQPHQPQDYPGVLCAQADEEGDRGREGGEQACGGETDRRRIRDEHGLRWTLFSTYLYFCSTIRPTAADDNAACHGFFPPRRFSVPSVALSSDCESSLGIPFVASAAQHDVKSAPRTECLDFWKAEQRQRGGLVPSVAHSKGG